MDQVFWPGGATAEATADPSAGPLAKSASGFAQDDIIFVCAKAMRTGLALAEDQAFGQHGLDAAEGLAGAFFVFDEGEADVVVAVVAAADAGGDGYFSASIFSRRIWLARVW